MEKVRLKDILKLSKESLRGKIICFPTDTVYGVGCIPNDIVGMEKIYAMKHREARKPLPILCSSITQVLDLVCDISSKTRELMDKYWPGALTLILNKKQDILNETYKQTLAVRIPNCEIALRILDYFSCLSTTSVNISGEKELNSIEEIEEKFKDFIDYLVIDEASFNKVPSTILDCTTEEIKVIRMGIIKV